MAAYLGTAMLFGLGWQGGLGRKTAIAILLIAYAGLMELLQNFSPGRHPEVEGVLTGGVGVLLGSALAFIIDRAWHQS